MRIAVMGAGGLGGYFGARLQQGGYEFAMLVAPFDSAWLAAAATRAGLQMTRPGRIGDIGNHHLRSFECKPLAECLPVADRRACHQRDPICHSCHGT